MILLNKGELQSKIYYKRYVIPMDYLMKNDLILAENDDFYMKIREKSVKYSYIRIEASGDGIQGSD